MAWPPPSPGYHISSTARTAPSHGMATGPGVLSTTTVSGLTAATSWISRSWPSGRPVPPPLQANTTAALAARAVATAAARFDCCPAGVTQSSRACTGRPEPSGDSETPSV